MVSVVVLGNADPRSVSCASSHSSARCLAVPLDVLPLQPKGHLPLLASGGWAAARYAELHPGRVRRLLLLNPGFELGRRWECIVGTAALEAWPAAAARAL